MPDPENAILVETERQLRLCFAGKRTRFEVPLDFKGTAFSEERLAAAPDTTS